MIRGLKTEDSGQEITIFNFKSSMIFPGLLGDLGERKK